VVEVVVAGVVLLPEVAPVAVAGCDWPPHPAHAIVTSTIAALQRNDTGRLLVMLSSRFALILPAVPLGRAAIVTVTQRLAAPLAAIYRLVT